MPEFKIIVHCAAFAHAEKIKKDDNIYEHNANIANLIKYFYNETYLIFLSSIAVYGEDNRLSPINESSKLRPFLIMEKVECEKLISNNVYKSIILRLCPVYNDENLLDIRKRYSYHFSDQ